MRWMKVGQVFIRVSIPREKDEEEKCDENVIPPELFPGDKRGKRVRKKGEEKVRKRMEEKEKFTQVIVACAKTN